MTLAECAVNSAQSFELLLSFDPFASVVISYLFPREMWKVGTNFAHHSPHGITSGLANDVVSMNAENVFGVGVAINDVAARMAHDDPYGHRLAAQAQFRGVITRGWESHLEPAGYSSPHLITSIDGQNTTLHQLEIESWWRVVNAGFDARGG